MPDGCSFALVAWRRVGHKDEWRAGHLQAHVQPMCNVLPCCVEVIAPFACKGAPDIVLATPPLVARMAVLPCQAVRPPPARTSCAAPSSSSSSSSGTSHASPSRRQNSSSSSFRSRRVSVCMHAHGRGKHTRIALCMGLTAGRRTRTASPAAIKVGKVGWRTAPFLRMIPATVRSCA